MLPSDSEFMQCRVFHKVLSRWQKLWSRRRRENSCHRRNLRGPKARVTRTIQEQESFCNLGLLDCISRILEQKLECLNRTQTSLNNFGFFGSFFFSQRIVGGGLLLKTLQCQISHFQLYTAIYSTVLLFCVDLRVCYMGQLDKSYSNKVTLRALLISCCINTLCNFFTILFDKILCQFQIIFTMTRQTTSSAHVVLCNIPNDVHVPSLRKQLTFYDATTGLPAK